MADEGGGESAPPHLLASDRVPAPVTLRQSLVASVLAGAAAVAPPAAVAAVPAPLEWEAAAPSAPAGARAARSRPATSPVIRARGRFNVVGLRWRGPAEPEISIRVREPGARWRRWTHVPAHSDGGPDAGGGERVAHGVSAPAWAGDARFVQYRLSRPVPGLRLHFVNSLRTTRALPTPVPARQAQAGEAAPPIVPRAAWGAASCAPRKRAEYGSVQAAVVHHTVTANGYTRQQAPAAILGICRYHRNSNRWNDLGYNFVVDRFGTIYEGRAGGTAAPVVGAQAQGVNTQTTGIANLGTYSAAYQTPEALAAVARLIRWKLPLSGAPTAGTAVLKSTGGETSRFPRGAKVALPRITGHRDANKTSCPGNLLFSQLGDLRARVGSLPALAPPPVAAPATPPRTKIEALVSPKVVSFGERPLVQGRLRLFRGDPVDDATIEVQSLTGTAWRTLAQTTSDEDGSFDVDVPASARRVLRVRFPGDLLRQASTSKRTVVLVRPTLSSHASVRRAAVGRTPVISGRISPAKRRLVMVVEHRRGRGGFRRVRREVLRVRGGEFRRGVRLGAPGLHRVTLVFTGDRRNLPVSGEAVYVRALASRGGGADAP